MSHFLKEHIQEIVPLSDDEFEVIQNFFVKKIQEKTVPDTGISACS